MSLIYLVGPRACGKTTLGKALSEVLDVPYCDTDHHLCERLGMDVATMVERWGWEGFRSRESESLHLASEELAGRGVVATGGGMVLAEANRRYMREHGRVFFLSAPVEVLAARHLGLRVLGISCLSNKNLPDCMAPTSLEEIVEVAARAGRQLERLLLDMVTKF